MELRKKENNKENKNVENINIQKVNVHKDHRSRLRKQFLNSGFSSLTEIQQLELLLFYAKPLCDTNPLAHRLLNKFGSIGAVLTADFKELVKVEGVKENIATFIKFIHDLVSNFHMKKNENETILNTTRLSRLYAKNLFVGATIEQFYVICLTSSNVVKKTILLQNGTIDEVAVDIRNITEAILETKCNRIIVCHNHPEGIARMSDNDCKFTFSLLCSCLLNSIYILDHVIVGKDKAITFHEQGIMERLIKRAVTAVQLSTKDQTFLASQASEYTVDLSD